MTFWFAFCLIFGFITGFLTSVLLSKQSLVAPHDEEQATELFLAHMKDDTQDNLPKVARKPWEPKPVKAITAYPHGTGIDRLKVWARTHAPTQIQPIVAVVREPGKHRKE